MKNEKVKIQILPTSDKVKIPAYETSGASGFDIRAFIPDEMVGIIIKPNTQVTIPTGLQVAIPPGYEIQIRPRSGLAHKYKLSITNSPGTIDSDFRDEIKIIIFNHSEETYCVKHDNRIAQGVLGEVPIAEFEIVESLSDPNSNRTGGFGHTGK
jgi:dUTP pyrophosphatase